MSAALILGRCRRQVLLCDGGTPRSWAAHRTYGFLSRDGMKLDDFRAASREQLAAYPGVSLSPLEVQSITALAEHGFEVELEDGRKHGCRKVLLASGVFDQLPAIAGIEDFFGVTVQPCPYCDGWELQDLPIAIYGSGERGFEMSRAMTAWSSDLLLCTDGPARLSAPQQQQLRGNGVDIVSTKIAGLVGENGQLQAIRFADGQQRERRALFFDTPCHPQSSLMQQLGCRTTRSGAVATGKYQESSVPGLYVAGNILKDVQLSIVAAAEGARAAFGINQALTREDFARRASACPKGYRASVGIDADTGLRR
jgi:thioredoxin reductase